MNLKGRLIVGLIAAVFVGGAAAYVELGKPPSILLKPDDPGVVSRGAGIYRTACASCHGANLEGQPNWQDRSPDGLLPAPPHDDSGHTWHHPDAVLFQVTKSGMQSLAGAEYKSAIPVFERRLSDEDIIAVLSFIESRWSPEIRRRHATVNQSADR